MSGVAWWEVLELSPEDDLRSIKRRYAQLLKQYRPDEDPQGFQRLREAYEAALLDQEQARQPSAAENSSPDEAAEVAEPEPRPAPRLVGQAADALDQWLSEAEFRGQRPAFERQVLAQCLEEGMEARPLVVWAVSRLGWFAAPTPSAPVDALPQLAGHLAEQDIERLCVRLSRRGAKAFLARLDAVLRQPWLQGIDCRDRFQHSLLERVRVLPHGAELFRPLCKRFGWSSADFPAGAAAFEAQSQQAGEAAFAAELQRSLARKRDRKPAQKAARLLLTPMSEAEQVRATRQFGRKEWKACKRLARNLERYPQVWADYGSPDLLDWRALVPPKKGWRHLTLALWLLAVVVLLLTPERDWAGDGLDVAVELAFVAAEALLLAVGVRMLMALGSLLLKPLEVTDLRLSRRLPGRARKGRQGLRILRHGLGCALLAGAAALLSGLPGGQAGSLGLGIFVGCLVYAAAASSRA